MSLRAERTTRVQAARGDPAEPKKKRPPLRKVLPEIWTLIKPRRWLLAFGFVLMVINRVSGLVLPASTKFLVDNVLVKKQAEKLPWIVGAVLLATTIQAITSFSLTQLLSKAAQRLIADLRMQVQQHIGRLSVSFYDATRTGVLVSRIMTDVEGVRNLIGTGLVDFVGGMLTAVLAFFILMRISPKITLISFAFVLTFVFILRKAFGVIRPIFRERGRINAEVTGRLTESLGGVRVVKGYHAEDREAGVFAAGVERLYQNVVRSLTATSLLSLAATAILGIVGATVMWLGARQEMAHKITLGDYFTYTMFLAFMVAPVFQVVNVGTQLTEAIAGLDRTSEILAEKEEDDEPGRTVVMGPIVGDVRFADVRFAYEPDKPVLHGISFQASPGTVTALVGSSGSGKSTIISLICAFHKPDSGQVLVDGIDLSTVRLNSYRSQLGVVLQESFLFDGTIRENVVFSRPNATEEQFLSACSIARVDEFALRFPEGYDTIVGERGVKLSGGQRQRLSIARAILADPRILILDEATSSLDSESEAMIQNGLSYLMQGRTTFVIAHRLSTIRRADQILVVEGGLILERGTHSTLYALEGRYHDLYTRQHGLEANRFLAPGEGEKLFTPKNWTFSGSARIDHFSNYDVNQFVTATGASHPPSFSETPFDPRLGVTRLITQSLALSASAFRAFRSPNEDELYAKTQVGQQVTLPNPNLRSERATGWETGLQADLHRIGSSVRVSYFFTQVNRPITTLTISTTPTSQTLMRANLGQIESRGLSLDYSARPARWISVDGGYQYADATVTKFEQQPNLVGNWIPEVARNMATAQVGFTQRRLGFLSFQGRVSGHQFDDTANDYYIPGYFRLDVYAAHEFRHNISLYAKGENLFDRAIIVGKTPLPTLGTPRVALFGLRYSFGG